MLGRHVVMLMKDLGKQDKYNMGISAQFSKYQNNVNNSALNLCEMS